MENNLNIGHRERLKEKFLNCEASSFHDYELLELLLTFAIPRMDVKPIAKKLILEFKNFAGVINAPIYKLQEIKGVGKNTAILINLVSACISKSLQNNLETENVFINNYEILLNYCKKTLSFKETEEFHILHFDSKLKLIKDETLFTGTINTSFVFPREVVKNVLHNNTISVILVHNHPSGDIIPSPADIGITKKICDALKNIDVFVEDHIIVGKNSHYSFRKNNLL